MVFMITAVWSADFLMLPMASVIFSMLCWATSAELLAFSAIRLVWLTFSAFCLVMEDISSSEAEVSSRLAA